MNLTEAAKILTQHNAWRRGDEGIDQLPGKLVGEAIDAVLAHISTAAPALTVDALAQEIGRIDGVRGPSDIDLARALLPFIERHIAAGQQGAGDVMEVDHIAALARKRMDDGATQHGKQWQQGGRTAINFMVDKIRRHARPAPPPASVPDGQVTTTHECTCGYQCHQGEVPMTAEPVRIHVTAPESEICLMRGFEELVRQASGNHALATLDPHEVARAVDWLQAKYGSKP